MRARWNRSIRIGIVVCAFALSWASAAAADDRKLPVPWPTTPGEVLPYGQTPPPARKPTAPVAVPEPPVDPIPSSTSTSTSASARNTELGALGEGLVFIDGNQNADWELPRLMPRLMHAPAPWLRFKVTAGLENADRFAVQQALVELSPSPAFGVRAGLLLLPLGIINQTNAFPTYLTVDRPLTDRLIIPTIWRELGAGIFGDVGGALRFELDVVGGLNGTGFAAQAPLAGGRGNGRDIAINGAAVTGRLELYSASTGFVMGGSGYYGSASGGQPLLDSVRVGIVEGDVQFRGGGFDLRAEYAQVFIFNSYRINTHLGLLGQDAIPRIGRGGYVQAGYDVLRLAGADIKQELLFFAGYENVNPRSAMSNYNYNPPAITGPGELAPNDPSPARAFVRGGIVFRPRPELAFKVDIQIALDGEGPPPAPPITLAGAPGMPRPLDPELALAVRGQTRVGLGVGFAF